MSPEPATRTTTADFRRHLRDAPLMLTEGSMYERLRRDPAVEFDPDIAHAALIYDEGARVTLEGVHGEYIAVAQRHGLPMIVTASTWRGNQARIARSRHAGAAVNQDNVAFVRGLADDRSTDAAPLFVAGALGPAGDAYRPDEARDADAAARVHAVQIEALAEAAPDLIVAATLPAVSEARGIARVLDGTGLPYLLSFVVRDTGTLLDGTPLGEALDTIDQERGNPPIGYMVNCVHPQVLGACLDAAGESASERIVGLRANTSTLRPQDLDEAAALITQPPDELAEHMLETRRRHGLRIVGGCCGTGTAHIDRIAAHCKASA